MADYIFIEAGIDTGLLHRYYETDNEDNGDLATGSHQVMQPCSEWAIHLISSNNIIIQASQGHTGGSSALSTLEEVCLLA